MSIKFNEKTNQLSHKKSYGFRLSYNYGERFRLHCKENKISPSSVLEEFIIQFVKTKTRFKDEHNFSKEEKEQLKRDIFFL